MLTAATQHAFTTKKELCFAWLLDDAAQAQFTAEIANALHVSTHLVERAHSYHGTFIDTEPFATLDAYIAAVRTARIAEVHTRQAELDAQEADYQKRRREELKLQRAQAQAQAQAAPGGLTRNLPTRIQPSRRNAPTAAGSNSSNGINKKQKKCSSNNNRRGTK
jgi:hypothetical protein